MREGGSIEAVAEGDGEAVERSIRALVVWAEWSSGDGDDWAWAMSAAPSATRKKTWGKKFITQDFKNRGDRI
jgi:hypothetical protein